MKYIIAGGRDFNNGVVLVNTLKTFSDITTIICGEARGADFLGKMYAINNNIPIESYPADWNQYGKAAGYIRNAEMGEEADAAIIFWDGQSPGSKNMIKTMKLHKKPYWVYNYQGELIERG